MRRSITISCMGLLLSLFSAANAQDSLNVRRLGEISAPIAFDVAVSESHAYVADFERGLQIIDIADPTSPAELSTYDTHGLAVAVALSGDYAFVADDFTGLWVVDVTNPNTPTLVGRDSTLPSIDVVISGSFAYVSVLQTIGGDRGLRSIDISDPAAPARAGFLAGGIEGVAVSGNYAYAAESERGLLVIDITNPAELVEVGACETPDIAAAYVVAVDGNYAYVAGSAGLVWVIDVTNPAAPVRIGYYISIDHAFGLVISGDYAYLAGGPRGLRVINISNLDSLAEVGFYNTAGSAQAVAVDGNLAYVADNDYFGIYDCSAALPTSPSRNVTVQKFSLSSVYPNPFNSISNLQLNLPQEMRGRLVVYDGLGRIVNTLLDGNLSAGSHDVKFYAQGLSSGTYFVRWESPEFNTMQKAVLIR